MESPFDPEKWLEVSAAIENDLQRLVTPLTESQFHAPPRDGGWSVGFCIEHLILTGRAYLPRWDAAIAGATALPGIESKFRSAWWQREILNRIESPSTVRSKADAALLPVVRRPIDQTVGGLFALHEDIYRRVTASRNLNWSRVKIQSPFTSWLSYSLGFSFRLVLAHERRHLTQAERTAAGSR